MTTYRIRVKDNASGFVARCAGTTLRPSFATYAEADRIRCSMPNGSQCEIVEVAA